MSFANNQFHKISNIFSGEDPNEIRESQRKHIKPKDNNIIFNDNYIEKNPSIQEWRKKRYEFEEKYKKDYANALVQIRAERARFQDELAKINGVRVIPSQANFVMVELDDAISPKDLLKRLLIKHNLLIKELTTKTNGRNYLRLAVRNTEDNNALIAAMRQELR